MKGTHFVFLCLAAFGAAVMLTYGPVSGWVMALASLIGLP